MFHSFCLFIACALGFLWPIYCGSLFSSFHGGVVRPDLFNISAWDFQNLTPSDMFGNCMNYIK